jgi:hypothetical protein
MMIAIGLGILAGMSLFGFAMIFGINAIATGRMTPTEVILSTAIGVVFGITLGIAVGIGLARGK